MNPLGPSQSAPVRDGVLDRFIPPRSLRSSEWRGAPAADADALDVTAQSILEKDLRSDRKLEYRRLLADALFGGRRGDRVLPLGLRMAGHGAAVPEHAVGSARQDWPVRARRDPLVGVPEITVGLPELPKVHAARACMNQLMAWGACGVLAVAGSRDVFLWRRPLDVATSGVAGASELLVRFGHQPTSLCWSPAPDRALLAIGVGTNGRVEMWDCDSKKRLFSRHMSLPAPIVAISWHPYNDVIALGCSYGIVFMVTSTLAVLKSLRVMPLCSSITALAFSPDGSLLACGGASGRALTWAWDTGIVSNDEVELDSPITSLCWHPWRGAVLAIGTLAGYIALLDFAKQRAITAKYTGSRNRPVSVTAMSFSERTAELVVAFAGKGLPQVAVLADLTTVVDRLKVHQDTVHYVCWSPDGTTLATAGADEMLCMWHFLGAKATKELKRRALQESREDRSGIRRQFGCIIR